MAAWLGRVLILWARYVSGVEAALSAAGLGAAPTLAPLGARELARAGEARSGSGPAARIGASAIGGARGAGLARRVAGDRHPRPHRCVGSVGCGRDLRLARKRARQRHRQVGRRRDLRRRLSGARHRQDSGPPHRPGGGRPRRGLAHGRRRRPDPRRSLPGRRLRHDHPVARDHDRGGQPAPVRLLRARQRVGGAPRASADRAACRRHHRLRPLLRLPGQRRDLPRPDAARAGVDAAA